MCVDISPFLSIYTLSMHVEHLWCIYLQEAYRAFHTDFTTVHKYMATLRLGRLQPRETNAVEDEMKKDFEDLRQRAVKLVSETLSSISPRCNGGLSSW